MTNIRDHICIIALGYPTDANPIYSFVDQLVCALADLGVKCSVIAPQSITKGLFRRVLQNPTVWSKTTKNNIRINVYQPYFISISTIKVFGLELGEIFSEILFERAVKKAFKQIKENPTIMYGHFWSCGLIAARIAQEESLPVYVACGESNIKILKHYRLHKKKQLLDYIKGVISVSSENKGDSIKLGLSNEEKIIVIPNGIDQRRFYKMNKSEARSNLGYLESDFIVAFVGLFSERKGSKRLSDALDKVGDVKSIFIGSGDTHLPNCDGILFCGQVAHKDVVKYLNCADVFVLPTLAEGSCNATIEAMACGLPIISSNLPCNDDILNNENAIRINPQSIDEIANSIRYLKDNPEVRTKMSESSLKTAANLLIEERAKKVLDFLLLTK